MRGESPLNQESDGRTVKQKIRRFILRRLLFPSVSRFLFIGTQNRRFYQHLGVPSHKLVFTPYAVDNDRFRNHSLLLEGQKKQLRQELSIPQEAFIILYTGKFIPKKRPLDLLQAMARIQSNRMCAVFVGDGELRNEMEAFISENKMQQQAHLAGFVNQSVIPRYYAAADAFVMCSGNGETWGLSVNEAMNFSLPVVVYDTVGCSVDLVKPGENGFIVPEGDIEALAKALTLLADDPDKCDQMGQVSLQIIGDYSFANIMGGLKTVGDAG